MSETLRAIAATPCFAASAAILAGGSSRRMGRDKAFLLGPRGRPIIAELVDCLASHFDEVMISANAPHRFDAFGCTVVTDRDPSRACALQGICSVLEASRNDRCFVMACDIPDPKLDLILALLDQDVGPRGIVPRSPSGFVEPVFAVYHRAMLPRLRAVLDAGEKRIRLAFDDDTVRYLDLPAENCIQSMNHPEDYQRWFDARQTQSHASPCGSECAAESR